MSAEIVPPSPRLLTKGAYAVHRGVSPSLITQWRKADRLVMAGRLVDADASDAKLAQSLDRTRGGRGGKASRVPEPGKASAAAAQIPSAPSSAPAAGNGAAAEPNSSTADFQLHRARREDFAARREEIDYRARVGELVEWDRTCAAVTAIGSTLRRATLRIPDALATRLAAEPDARKVRTMLVGELEQLLRDMADAVGALPAKVGAAGAEGAKA